MGETVETVVIGGGQAGLAMSYHLSRLGCEHIVLERARIAERWRTQRWDSLMFQFPNWSIELPGFRYRGEAPDDFAGRNAIVEFLEEYRASIRAPVRTGVNVRSLRSASRADRYLIETDEGEQVARNVVIATGPYQRPRIPSLASRLPDDVVQLHAGEYRNARSLPPGAVLVVGAGASGCQIAEELLEEGRRVHLSVGRHRRIPRRYRGQDVFWWRRELGHLDLTAEETPPERRMPAPLVTGVGGGHDIDLRAFAANGMALVGRVVDIGDDRIAVAADLEDSLREGERAFHEFTRAVDAYVRKAGIDAPEQGPGTPVRLCGPVESAPQIDIRAASIGAVIWATGYDLDLRWVELPIFDERSRPLHRRGVTGVEGIYLLGLRWLHKAKSSFLCGVGEDAEFLAERIADRRG